MRRLLTLCLIIVATGVLPLIGVADDDQTSQVWELIKSARELANNGDLAVAEEQLLKARALMPDYVEVYAHLGYVYELQGQRGKAIGAYAELLRRRPNHDYAREHLQALFYEGEFPRSINARDLAFSPVSFVVDRCHVIGPAGDAIMGLAYTTDLLYHEAMERGGPPVEIEVPAAGGQQRVVLNRSNYAFISAPGSDVYNLKFILSYPSALISQTGQDYRVVAAPMAHLMLRAYCYFDSYLGKQPPGETPVKAYLMENGPPGAETYSDALYFYAADSERSSVEWARQIGHEYGHLVLPPVGRYMEPEFYASGLLGERLFIQWLADEAQTVSQCPWPGEAAQASLDRLLAGDGKFDAAAYLATTAYADLAHWYEKGPDAAFIAGTGEESMHYWLGMMMWTEMALGRDGLRSVIDAAPGTSPADFLLAIKRVVQARSEDQGALTFSSAALDIQRSKLSAVPVQGALGWNMVVLDAGDSASFNMYIPEGLWSFSIPSAPEGLTLTFDGRGPFPISSADGLSLGEVEAGWHSIVVGNTGAAFQLRDMVLNSSPRT